MRTEFGGGSRQSRLVGLTARHTVRPIITAWSLLPRAPWLYAAVDQAGRLQRPVRGTTFEQVRLPHCRAELITTPSSGHRVVLYLHGGAFLVGGRRLHRALISRIAEATRSTVLAVEYRKLPRHSIDTSTADCLDGYRHLLESGAAPEDLLFMGDSAGGFLTFTTAEAAQQAGLPTPAGIVAISPLIDFDLERTPLDNERGCDIFNNRAIPAFVALGNRRSVERVRCPADVDPDLLPPVLLQVSSSETLFGQVATFAERLHRAGVPVELQVWDGQLHVFQALGALPEARQAITQIAAFVDRVAPALRAVRSA